MKNNDIQTLEAVVDETKNKLNKNKYFHFAEDTHIQRNVFLNKISQLDNFNSILIAQDKLELVNICKMAKRENLTSQELFEHIVFLLIKEIKYMFKNFSDNLEFELIFEENKSIDYISLEQYVKDFSDEKINFIISLCTKECKCVQIADYLAGILMSALDENKFDGEIDESYINKLIGKFYHYDERVFPNIARLMMCRTAEGPYKHRIHLSSSHAFGKFEMKKQGWARLIQECF